MVSSVLFSPLECSQIMPRFYLFHSGSFVFVRRGIVPEACSTYFLTRIVGMGKALEWVTTGRVFTARDEAASGLFNYVLPADQVVPKALAIAREIADNTSLVSNALAKQLVWDGQRDDATPERAHLYESKAIFYTGYACVGTRRTRQRPTANQRYISYGAVWTDRYSGTMRTRARAC